MRSFLLILFILSGIAIIFYLSWLPDPKIGITWFIPDWMATWTDARENDTIRTGVPFILLGMGVGCWLFRKTYSWPAWIISWFGMVAVVLAAETGQIFLPYRSFDWYDIAWGALGAVVGLSIALVSPYTLKRLKLC